MYQIDVLLMYLVYLCIFCVYNSILIRYINIFYISLYYLIVQNRYFLQGYKTSTLDHKN